MSKLTVIHGDCLTELAKLPSESVQCCVSSPPYWRLRDYGHPGQIGQEATSEKFVGVMVQVFREVRRALKNNGTFWLNLGDTYEDDQLAGIPWRAALALKDDGWRLVSEVVWSKPKGAPAGGARKPLRSHEQVFMFAKTSNYLYDADGVREPLSPATLARYKYSVKAVRSRASGETSRKLLTPNPDGRYRRSVWTATPVFIDGHEAAMPDEIVSPCILAGSRIGDMVLDPFGGSGTTGKVALNLSRDCTLIELNGEYLPLIAERTGTSENHLKLHV